MKQNFIKTFDSDVATLLLKSGFVKVENNEPNTYTFINDQSLKFDGSIDMSKITFTNKICFWDKLNCVITSSFDGVFIIPFFKEGRYVE